MEMYNPSLRGEVLSLKALLLIDLQNDFIDPNGALYFEGAEGIIPFVIKKIEEFKEEDLPIITTQDWHNLDDEEFKLFTKHCVMNTWGAMLQHDIEKALEGYKKHYKITKKRYSAFFRTNFDGLIEDLKLYEIEVCGVATNICVLFTVEELRNRNLKVKVYKDGVKSYDDNLHKFALDTMERVLGVEVI